MTPIRRLIASIASVLLALCMVAGTQAQPRFPELTGRVVDQADLLSPAQEAELSARLESLERDTSDQLVVVTLENLQGYEIEDYGYQLGRAWRIGQAEGDNGALLIVAPEERRVRIEVGYGLEPILTDALSTLIIQERILPAFRDDDYPRGIAKGVEAIDEQLRLDPVEAQARAADAATAQSTDGEVPVVAVLLIAAFLFLLFGGLIGGLARGGGRRHRRRGVSPVLIWAASEAMRGGGRSSWGGGGRSGGFGGFSGGGGSFGGGGASGGW